MMTRVPILGVVLLMTLATAPVVFAAAGSANVLQSDRVAEVEKKLIIEAWTSDCGSMNEADCASVRGLRRGINLKAKTVEVKAQVLKEREDDLLSMESQTAEDAHKGNGGASIGRLMLHCKLKSAPKIQVDIGRYLANTQGRVAGAINNVATHMWSACSGANNADNIALMQKIKIMHFKLGTPAKGEAETFSFDPKTGVFTDVATNGMMTGSDDAAEFVRFLKAN